MTGYHHIKDDYYLLTCLSRSCVLCVFKIIVLLPLRPNCENKIKMCVIIGCESPPHRFSSLSLAFHCFVAIFYEYFIFYGSLWSEFELI